MSEELNRENEEAWLEEKHDLEDEIKRLKTACDKEFRDCEILSSKVLRLTKERAEVVKLLEKIKTQINGIYMREEESIATIECYGLRHDEINAMIKRLKPAVKKAEPPKVWGANDHSGA